MVRFLKHFLLQKYRYVGNSIQNNIGLPRWLSGKESACQCKRLRFDPWVRKVSLKNEMATQSSILAWKIPWTEEPGRLQSMGSQRVRHDWVTNTYFRVRLANWYFLNLLIVNGYLGLCYFTHSSCIYIWAFPLKKLHWLYVKENSNLKLFSLPL